MFCEKCGTQLPDGAKFCGSCGAKTEAGQEQSSTYTPPAAPQPPLQDNYASQASQYTQPVHGSEPLSVGQYIGMFVLMVIPLVNIILMFVWGFGSDVNLNKKNYARAMLIMAAISLVLSIISAIAFGGFIASLGSMLDGSSYY